MRGKDGLLKIKWLTQIDQDVAFWRSAWRIVRLWDPCVQSYMYDAWHVSAYRPQGWKLAVYNKHVQDTLLSWSASHIPKDLRWNVEMILYTHLPS